jgi:hypothetical protein
MKKFQILVIRLLLRQLRSEHGFTGESVHDLIADGEAWLRAAKGGAA